MLLIALALALVLTPVCKKERKEDQAKRKARRESAVGNTTLAATQRPSLSVVDLAVCAKDNT